MEKARTVKDYRVLNRWNVQCWKICVEELKYGWSLLCVDVWSYIIISSRGNKDDGFNKIIQTVNEYTMRYTWHLFKRMNNQENNVIRLYVYKLASIIVLRGELDTTQRQRKGCNRNGIPKNVMGVRKVDKWSEYMKKV